MEISFDPEKRRRTLAERGLDFADAEQVFSGRELTRLDTRFVYAEDRFQTFGFLGERLVMIVWAETADGRRIISMRKCNDREQTRIGKYLGRS